MTDRIIGIDISKDRLQVHSAADGRQAGFGNDIGGIGQLLAWLGRTPARVVFEATGRYHLALERQLDAAGHAVVKVNPRQAKRFGEALGVRAKTDPADAAMLARMGAALRLEPAPVRSRALAELGQLVVARRALIKDRIAARNRAEGLGLALLRRQNAARLKRIERDLRAIDREISARIAADPALAERHAILVSIPGVSDITAAALIVLAPELGCLGPRQAAKLAGLAPITRQSGKWNGKAFLRGGRAELRHALYMPALVAKRRNPDHAAFAHRLADRGKPPKVVIAAVMRKLFLLANALLRDRRKWTPKAA